MNGATGERRHWKADYPQPPPSSGGFARRFQVFFLPKITHILVVAIVLTVLVLRSPLLASITLYSCLFFASHGITMALYLMASMLDPGYVSRGSVRSLLESMSSGAASGTFSHLDSSDDSLEDDEDEEPLLQLCYKETPISFRRCNYCQLMQPLRAKHCEECGRCIRKFDHHCPWLGNCVGEKNHKFFWCLMFCGLLTTIWSLQVTYQSFLSAESVSQLLQSNWLLILVFLIELLFLCVTMVLFSAHTYLMVTNQTSWEFLARSRITYLRDLSSDDNPFDSGVLKNCYTFLCNCSTHNWECHFMRVSATQRPANNSSDSDNRSSPPHAHSVSYSKDEKPASLDRSRDSDQFVNTV